MAQKWSSAYLGTSERRKGGRSLLPVHFGERCQPPTPRPFAPRTGHLLYRSHNAADQSVVFLHYCDYVPFAL